MWTFILTAVGGFIVGAWAMHTYTTAQEKKKTEKMNPILTPVGPSANYPDT